MRARGIGPARARASLLMLAEALVVGVSLAGLHACAEAEAGADDARRPSVRAGRIDQVQLGFALNLEGRVGTGCTSEKFALNDPIHLSMKITDAAPGTIVHVSVRDLATHRLSWSEARPVASGASYATFEIGRELPEGRYRAESTLGGAATNPREFVVHVWNPTR